MNNQAVDLPFLLYSLQHLMTQIQVQVTPLHQFRRVMFHHLHSLAATTHRKSTQTPRLIYVSSAVIMNTRMNSRKQLSFHRLLSLSPCTDRTSLKLSIVVMNSSDR